MANDPKIIDPMKGWEQHWPCGWYCANLKFWRKKVSKREREKKRLELLKLNAAVRKELDK